MAADLRASARTAERTPRAMRHVAGVAALALPAAGALLVATAAADHASFLVPAGRHRFPGWLAGPLAGTGIHMSVTGFGVVLVVMFAAYLLALGLSATMSPRAAAVAIVGAHVAVILAPPLLSADVFGYLGYARLGTLHGVSPYAEGAAALAGDPVRPFVLWHNVTSPYGPLFTLASYALVPLGIPVGLWTLKAIAGTCSLGAIALVWRTARRLGRPPIPAALFLGLNPLVLIYGVGGAHNDLVVALMVMGAIALLTAEREGAAGGGVVAAIALKTSAGLVAPYMLAGARQRQRFLGSAALAAVVVVAAAALALGGHVLGSVSALREQQQLTAIHSVPSELGRLLGLGGITTGIRVVATAGLLVTVGLTVGRAWRGSDWIAMAGWATLALLVTTAWLLPWYVVWLLPLAALSADRRLRLATLALCLFVVAGHVSFLLG